MERQSTAPLLIVLLLVANIAGLYYVVQVKNEVAQLRTQVSQLGAEVSSAESLSSQLSSQLSAMREEQEWSGPADVAVGDRSAEGLSVLVSWQVKEYSQGSAVTLHWQKPGSGVFEEIAAEDLGGGRFQAKVVVPTTVMPDVTVSSVGSKTGDTKAMPLNLVPKAYTYFVSMKTGNTVKSTDPRMVDLSKLDLQSAYRLNLTVTTNEPGKSKLTLNETPVAQYTPPFRLQGATLEGYSGSTKALEVTLESARTTQVSVGSETVQTPVFEAYADRPARGLSDLWLNLTYSGGQSARVELPVSSLW